MLNNKYTMLINKYTTIVYINPHINKWHLINATC